MSYQGPMLIREPELRWPIILLAAIVTALIALFTAGLQYLVMTRPYLEPYAVPVLEKSLRLGDSEFEQLRGQIAIGQLVGKEKLHPFNNLVVEMTATIRNNTGRSILGLEIKGAVLDSEGMPVGQRTVVVIPTRQTALEPGEEINVRILLESISRDSDRSQLKMEVTGLRFD